MAFAEDDVPAYMVRRACERYARGEVGLRGAARLIKVKRGKKKMPVSAMTMAQILRRNGYVVRLKHEHHTNKRLPPPLPVVEAPAIETNEAMPWSVGAQAPAPVLPSAETAAPQPPVLDVGASPVELPPYGDPTMDASDTREDEIQAERYEARHRVHHWLPQPMEDALRSVGSALHNRLELDPALPPRELDRIEWEASHSWRRMLISCLWADDGTSDWSPLPVVKRLLSLIEDAPPPEEHAERVTMYLEWANRTLSRRNERRGAQHGLYAVFVYAARAVRELDPERSFATADKIICTLFRMEYPEAPPGFRLVGT